MTGTADPEFKPSLPIKALVAFLYFTQGIYLSFISSIIYLYPVFPDSEVLSAFSLASLPFSFKFLTAPIVQKYSLQSYGRRKFWITLSLFAASVITFPLAFIADKQEEYLKSIGILFVIVLLVSMGDVALDAAAVKELEDPALAGYLQASMQPVGIIVGRIALLNAANPTYWNFLGIDGPLCSTQTLLIAVGVIGLVVAVIIHFLYRERVIEEQEEDQTPAFKTIFKYYLHFVNPKYALCRTTIYFLFIFQGLKFFRVNYTPEAIYRGFSKERAAEIQSSCVVIAVVVNTILNKFLTKENMYNFIVIFYFLELLVFSCLFYLDSFDGTVVIAAIYFMQIVAYMRFLVHSVLTNGFGHSRFAGLCLTTLASFINFSNNTWLQLKAKGELGYYPSVGGGLVFSWIIGVFLLRPVIAWMRAGEPETHVHELHQKEKEN